MYVGTDGRIRAAESTHPATDLTALGVGPVGSIGDG